MYSKRSKPSRSDPPHAVKDQLLAVFSSASQGDVFTLDQLTDQVKADRRDTIAYWLSDLLAGHVIDQFVTVISPKNQGGISQFPTIDEVPDAIYDPYQMKEIEVEPQLIRIYFTKHASSTESRAQSRRLGGQA